MSRAAETLALAAVLALVLWGVVEHRGASPATLQAVAIGLFLGLVSLVVENGLLERAERSFHAQGVQAVFMSFVMRLVVVAPLVLLFGRAGSGTDAEAFALSYCSTFFVYLVGLTWKTYHAPVQYCPVRAERERLERGPSRGARRPADERPKLVSVGDEW